MCAACGSTDAGPLLRPLAGAGGEGSAGSAGKGGSGSAGASGGVGGSSGSAGGSDTAPQDAGLDATSDAASERSCVVGSLEAYCAVEDEHCPASYTEARSELSDGSSGGHCVVLQQFCAAPDGSQRVRVSELCGSGSLSYIFEPTTQQLVSVHLYDDTGKCSASRDPSDGRFGSDPGFYGEDLPNCALDYAHYVPPAQCDLPPDFRNLDAGALRRDVIDAGADAGSFENGVYECVLAP
jgi:hypothetical protein